MPGTQPHSVSVAGVVLNDAGQVLMVKRHDNGHWEPPGGVLELDETFEQGVCREVLEETGIRVSVGPLTGVYKNMTRGIVALVFRCTVKAGQARTSDEATEVSWLEPADALARMTPAYAVRVNDALPGSDIPHVRIHDGTHLVAP